VRDRRFERLEAILLGRGVASGYAERLIAELDDHCCDLESEHRAAGESASAAASMARDSLGSDLAIVEQVLVRPELRGRWSAIRAALRPLTAVLPLEPLALGGAVAGPALARWGVSITFGALLTVALLFAMARTVAIGV
jgi:hypothetical protein